ncbi:MAG TPA: MerR family transcriptional regulator, partial [Spirochaetia bacterium]|nr:MerR family transcriptional regulator [Spirochaetia bacterium]
SRLGELFGISRSTLLYYDAKGILAPSGRTLAGYRMYSDQDRARLQTIVLFRGLGLPLRAIKEYLDNPKDGATALLLRRMFSINEQLNRLADQQKTVLALIEKDGTLKGAKRRLLAMKDLGSKAGLSASNYRRVHEAFERASPETHRQFLRHLGFTDAEVRRLLKGLSKGS